MKRFSPAFYILFVLGISVAAQSLDPTGFSRERHLRERLPTNNPSVSFEIESDGAARFYSSVQPFRGVAITPDGRNVYLGR